MPDYRVKSPVGYAIAEGVREAMREYQRGREQEKQDIMMKAMMGIPLTPKEEKRWGKIGFEIPAEYTTFGEKKEAQKRHEEEQRVVQEERKEKQRRYEEEQKATLAKVIQERKEWETEQKMELQKLAIRMATKKKKSLTGAEEEYVDPGMVDQIYSSLLTQHGFAAEAFPISKHPELSGKEAAERYLPFLRTYPVTPEGLPSKAAPKQTMTEEEYLRKRRR